MTNYDTIADVEATHAVTLAAKDDGDGIKVSIRLNKFVIKMMTVVAVVALVGVIAVRVMAASAAATPKMTDVDIDALAGYMCYSPGDCSSDMKCCLLSGNFGMCYPSGSTCPN